ncbi:MAG: bacterial Ig-like domain-containing protein [Oscillospiraceae bacterium]|nr:bacterial Ig-like domain-containing protein [Oscillospiraceae bacterium]
MNEIVLNRKIAESIFNDNILYTELAELLNELIDEELAKPDGEADFDLIDEYSEALNDLYGERGAVYVLHRLQTADEFIDRLSGNKKWKNINRAFKITLAACAVMALLFTANTVTEKTTGIDVLGGVAQAFRDFVTGERHEEPTLPALITEPVTESESVTEEASTEPVTDTSETAVEKDAPVTVTPSRQTQQGNTTTDKDKTDKEQTTSVAPKNPNLSQVLSPEEPPTEPPTETTTREPFTRVDEDATAAPQIIKLTGTYSSDFKRTYKVGEEADFSGLTVTAVYDNGTEKIIPISACSIYGFSTATPANRIVTVEFEGCSFSYLIRVEEEK